MVDDLEVRHRIEMPMALTEFAPTVVQAILLNLNPVNMMVNGLCARQGSKM
jgi:hypothetical protein